MDPRRHREPNRPAASGEAGAATGASSRAPTPLSAGSLVGRYCITRTLGIGGMGTVYACVDRELHRPVALKVMHPRRDDVWRLRLMREAQAMASLKHPNVVTVYDVGVDNERVYVAMELVDGGTLRNWLRLRRSVREVAALFLAAGRGLLAAHKAGLVHRDFKPDNVLVSHTGEVLVTDFGLVRMLGDERAAALPPSLMPPAPAVPAATATLTDPGPPAPTTERDEPASVGETPLGTPLTRAGSVLGTPGYMSPEQLSGGSVDARSDQFAFCAALYEALYGRRFVVAGAESPRPSDLPAARGRVPARLKRALVRGLSSSREQRFSDLTPLLQLLEATTRRRAPRLLATAAIAAALVAVSAWRGPSLLPPCRDAALPALPAWSAAAAATLSRRLAAPGFDPRAGALRVLDDYAARWRAAQRQACGAALVEHRDTPSTLALRRCCLDQDADELRATLDAFRDAPPEKLRALSEAAGLLSAPEECLFPDVASEEALPAGDEARAQALADRRVVTLAKASMNAARYEDALAALQPLLSRPEDTIFAPVRARALLVRGDVRILSGHVADAVEDLKASYASAERGGSDKVKFQSAIGLAMNLIDQHKLDEAHDWIAVAQATSRHRAADGRVRAQLLDVTARWQTARGQLSDAIATTEQAIAAARTSVDPLFAGEFVFYAEGALADAAAALGRVDESLAHAERQLAWTAHLPPDRPERLLVKATYGARLCNAGRLREGVAQLEQALAGADRELPASADLFAMVHDNLGRAYADLGDPERARHELDRALEMLQKSGGERQWSVGFDLVYRGRVEAELGDGAGARQDVQRGMRILEITLPANDATLAEALALVSDVDRKSGRAAQGRDELRRAVAMFTREKTVSLPAAEARFRLAQLERGQGATQLASEARRELVQLGRHDRARAIDVWMAGRHRR